MVAPRSGTQAPTGVAQRQQAAELKHRSYRRKAAPAEERSRWRNLLAGPVVTQQPPPPPPEQQQPEQPEQTVARYGPWADSLGQAARHHVAQEHQRGYMPPLASGRGGADVFDEALETLTVTHHQLQAELQASGFVSHRRQAARELVAGWWRSSLGGPAVTQRRTGPPPRRNVWVEQGTQTQQVAQPEPEPEPELEPEPEPESHKRGDRSLGHEQRGWRRQQRCGVLMNTKLAPPDDGDQEPEPAAPGNVHASSEDDTDSLVLGASEWANDDASQLTGPRSLPDRPRTYGREQRGSVAPTATAMTSAADLAALAVAEMDSLMEEEDEDEELDSQGTITPRLASAVTRKYTRNHHHILPYTDVSKRLLVVTGGAAEERGVAVTAEQRIAAEEATAAEATWIALAPVLKLAPGPTSGIPTVAKTGLEPIGLDPLTVPSSESAGAGGSFSETRGVVIGHFSPRATSKPGEKKALEGDRASTFIPQAQRNNLASGKVPDGAAESGAPVVVGHFSPRSRGRAAAATLRADLAALAVAQMDGLSEEETDTPTAEPSPVSKTQVSDAPMDFPVRGSSGRVSDMHGFDSAGPRSVELDTPSREAAQAATKTKAAASRVSGLLHRLQQQVNIPSPERAPPSEDFFGPETEEEQEPEPEPEELVDLPDQADADADAVIDWSYLSAGDLPDGPDCPDRGIDLSGIEPAAGSPELRERRSPGSPSIAGSVGSSSLLVADDESEVEDSRDRRSARGRTVAAAMSAEDLAALAVAKMELEEDLIPRHGGDGKRLHTAEMGSPPGLSAAGRVECDDEAPSNTPPTLSRADERAALGAELSRLKLLKSKAAERSASAGGSLSAEELNAMNAELDTPSKEAADAAKASTVTASRVVGLLQRLQQQVTSNDCGPEPPQRPQPTRPRVSPTRVNNLRTAGPSVDTDNSGPQPESPTGASPLASPLPEETQTEESDTPEPAAAFRVEEVGGGMFEPRPAAAATAEVIVSAAVKHEEARQLALIEMRAARLQEADRDEHMAKLSAMRAVRSYRFAEGPGRAKVDEVAEDSVNESEVSSIAGSVGSSILQVTDDESEAEDSSMPTGRSDGFGVADTGGGNINVEVGDGASAKERTHAERIARTWKTGERGGVGAAVEHLGTTGRVGSPRRTATGEYTARSAQWSSVAGSAGSISKDGDDSSVDSVNLPAEAKKQTKVDDTAADGFSAFMNARRAKSAARKLYARDVDSKPKEQQVKAKLKRAERAAKAAPANGHAASAEQRATSALLSESERDTSGDDDGPPFRDGVAPTKATKVPKAAKSTKAKRKKASCKVHVASEGRDLSSSSAESSAASVSSEATKPRKNLAKKPTKTKASKSTANVLKPEVLKPPAKSKSKTKSKTQGEEPSAARKAGHQTSKVSGALKQSVVARKGKKKKTKKVAGADPESDGSVWIPMVLRSRESGELDIVDASDSAFRAGMTEAGLELAEREHELVSVAAADAARAVEAAAFALDEQEAAGSVLSDEAYAEAFAKAIRHVAGVDGMIAQAQSGGGTTVASRLLAIPLPDFASTDDSSETGSDTDFIMSDTSATSRQPGARISPSSKQSHLRSGERPAHAMLVDELLEETHDNKTSCLAVKSGRPFAAEDAAMAKLKALQDDHSATHATLQAQLVAVRSASESLQAQVDSHAAVSSPRNVLGVLGRLAGPQHSFHLLHDEREQLEHAAVLRQIKQAMHAKRRIHGHSIENSRDLFQSIDHDHSGMMNVEEFTGALHQLDVGLTSMQVVALARRLDRDGNGEIDYEELLDYLHGDLTDLVPHLGGAFLLVSLFGFCVRAFL